MRARQQRYLADVVRTQRARLEQRRAGAADEQATRDVLLDALELLDWVEQALRRPRSPRGSVLAVLKRRLRTMLVVAVRVARITLQHARAAVRAPAVIARRRLQRWLTPSIGILVQHAPRALTLPVKYWVIDPPERPPTISIVTPSFQQGKFLERTLYSVVSQHYPALEYVVQDGGSTDGTVDVLRRFDHLLSGWVSESDGGQADAINRGFARTSGEIMAWLNADDLLLPGSLSYVARYFVEHPDVDVVYGHRILIDVDDRRIGSWILPAHDDRALALADYVPQETLFWRRRIWEAVGGYVDTSFDFALDWDLLLRMRAAGAKMVRLPRVLGAFRVHEAQKTIAEGSIGLRECMRLRERVHGRGMSIDEVLARLFPYMLRHVAARVSHASANAVQRPRHPVRTTPHEPWLTAASAESGDAAMLPVAPALPAAASAAPESTSTEASHV